jgi:outer membrane protein
MSKRIFSILVLAGLLVLPLTSNAGKIGFVNVTKLFNEYAKVKGIDKMIEAKFNGPKKDIEALIADIKSLEKEIKTNELLMTESKLVTSRTKLKNMLIEYREKGSKLENELKVVRNEEMAAFRKIVFGVTQKFAAEKQYDLIVNEGVMFAAESIDITDAILANVVKEAK